MTVLAYIAAYALVPLFGLSLASSIGSRSARIGFAFLAGALLLTIEATLFTMTGIRWSIVGLSLPLLMASGVVLRRKTPEIPGSSRAARILRSFGALRQPQDDKRGTPIAIIVIAVLHFLLSIITTQSINPDYVLFWGTKSVHFAMSRSIDAGYLLSRYAPPRIDYPPLLPIVQSWGLLFSHQMPW
ncbi:MAG: hypothetical protein WB973_10420, partial [Thermoanaerobaculia bacterium]